MNVEARAGNRPSRELLENARIAEETRRAQSLSAAPTGHPEARHSPPLTSKNQR